MSNSSSDVHLSKFALLFLIISVICSLQRFGERENEHMPGVSDSDLYIDMAHVFVGDAKDFNRVYVAAQPHHYNRPLFPFLAGHLARYALHDNFRAAFSIIDILAATLIATLLFRLLLEHEVSPALAWMPSVLFLSGFPQINWGYHILTDTLGFATAFGVAYFAAWLIRTRQDAASSSRGQQLLYLALLFVGSSLAFLARETGWIAVVTSAWLVFARRSERKRHGLRFGLILSVLVAGKIPHSIYAHLWHTSGLSLLPSFASLTDYRYVADFIVKTAVCFNLSWLLAALGLFKHDGDPVPPFLQGWTISSIAYMGAGYLANSQEWIGYPLRLSYSLFPLIFFLVARFFWQRAPAGKGTLLAVGYCTLQYGVNLLGVLLDPGRSQFRTTDVIRALKEFLIR